MRSAATNAVNNMLHTERRLDRRSKTAGSVAKAKFQSASSERPADKISSSRNPVRQKRPSRRSAAADAAIAAVVSSATCSAGARYAKLRLATSTSANVAVYAALLVAGLHYLAAAAVAFLVAAASNYVLNRTWTFHSSDAPVLGQGARALTVSALSLGANQLFLVVLVAGGAGHLAAQAVAIVLATPFSFVANKLWAFAAEPSVGELKPVVIDPRRR